MAETSRFESRRSLRLRRDRLQAAVRFFCYGRIRVILLDLFIYSGCLFRICLPQNSRQFQKYETALAPAPTPLSTTPAESSPLPPSFRFSRQSAPSGNPPAPPALCLNLRLTCSIPRTLDSTCPDPSGTALNNTAPASQPSCWILRRRRRKLDLRILRPLRRILIRQFARQHRLPGNWNRRAENLESFVKLRLRLIFLAVRVDLPSDINRRRNDDGQQRDGRNSCVG